MQATEDGIFRRSEVDELTGLSDNTRRRMIERGDFPAPIQIAPRVIGWRRSDIRAWLESRPIAHLPPVGRKATPA
jgi:prophage regulatory protein